MTLDELEMANCLVIERNALLDLYNRIRPDNSYVINDGVTLSFELSGKHIAELVQKLALGAESELIKLGVELP